MTTAIIPRSRGLAQELGRTLACIARAAAHRPGRRPQRPARPRRRHDSANLDTRLNDRLRHDIGLTDSRPTPAERLERFHQSHRCFAREHEIRLKIWIDL